MRGLGGLRDAPGFGHVFGQPGLTGARRWREAPTAAVLASTVPYRGRQAARRITEQVRVYLGQEDGDVMPYPLVIGPGQESDDNS